MWPDKCFICGQDHKDVVCRKNPNAKLCWELASSLLALIKGLFLALQFALVVLSLLQMRNLLPT